jgi:hypothetical protein
MTALDVLAFWTLVSAVALYFKILVTGRFRDPLEAFYLQLFYVLTAVAPVYASQEFSRPEAAALGLAMFASFLAYSVYASRKRSDA